MRLPIFQLLLSSALAASPIALLPAQGTEPVRDTLTSIAIEDSLGQGQRNWLVSLLRKIARRSDDSLSTTLGTSDGEIEAERAPATAFRRRAFTSRKDSVAFESARAAAGRAPGYRVVVDIFAHQLHVINKDDTLLTAPVATATNSTLTYGGRTWRFETPRGVRRVLSKDRDPVWTPPEWHFAEVALEHGLKLKSLQRGQVVRLRDGTKLTSRGDEVGIIAPGEKQFQPLVLDEHVVFDNTIFIPPAGTKHRTIQGELGHYRLALGDGYLLHGTPYANSIGSAVTHGCVRLRDDDIEWLFNNVPVGTKVYIY